MRYNVLGSYSLLLKPKEYILILYENTIEHFKKAVDNRTLIRYIISEYESAMNMKIDPLLKAQWKYMIIMLGDVILFDNDINNI